jgi:endonuclease/exonuclease/phosphatase (EEP) superfamily protein YafD
MGDAELSSDHADEVVDAPAVVARSRFQKYARAASALSLAAVLVPVVVRLTGWEAGPLAYAVAFLPWVALACAVPFALAILGRSRVLTAAVLLPFVACLVWMEPLYWSWNVLSASDVELRVATVNATLGQADADAIVAMVKDRSIDVLAVEELTPREVGALHAAGLDDELPYSELAPQQGVRGTGMWSRLPLSSAEPVAGLRSHAVRASVSVGSEPLWIYSVHPAAPGLFDHSTWTDDMEALGRILRQTKGPVIVAGDFNATRDQRPFRDIEALGFKDAADQAGSGFVPTFPNGRLPIPVVAIDHVMVRSSRLSAVSVTSVVVPGADHRALVVTYVWQK